MQKEILEIPDPIQTEEEKQGKGLKRLLSGLFEILQMLAMALVLYFIIDSVVARVRVFNISMEPTLTQGEILMVNKLHYNFVDMQYGDIITFHFPLDPERDYVKRLIGLPGDEVVIEKGKVFVNGLELYEPYISMAPDYEGTWSVPQENLFVLGDNRNPSADSHVWGFVPLDHVIGKAFLVYWPIPQIRTLPTPNLFMPPG
jgi:signal peptidase I